MAKGGKLPMEWMTMTKRRYKTQMMSLPWHAGECLGKYMQRERIDVYKLGSGF